MELLPLTLIAPDAVEAVRARAPDALVARLRGAADGWLCDATFLPDFNMAVLSLFSDDQAVIGSQGSELTLDCQQALFPTAQVVGAVKPERLRGELNNASVAFGSLLVLKFFRRVENGSHPESELGQLLARAPGFTNAAVWLGELKCHRRRSLPICLGVAHQFVPNEGNAWQLTLDELSSFFERVTSLPAADQTLPGEGLFRLRDGTPPPSVAVTECVGGFLETVRLIARRLAELHVALASDREQQEFSPEDFSPQYQRSIYQSMRKLVADTLYRLSTSRNELPVECQPLCDTIVSHEQALERRFQWLTRQPLESQRIRCHGDCNLGQLLFNGKDFVFIDFEGSPLQSLGERRIKRSPLRDVAGLLCSFDYAALSALRGLTDGRGRPVGAVRSEDVPLVTDWTNLWSRLVQQTFVTMYWDHTRTACFSPPNTDEFYKLLDTFLLEKILIDSNYELIYRPDWLVIPLLRLAETLSGPA